MLALKKLSAILLLFIYLLSQAGYTLLFQYFIEDAEKKIEHRISSNIYNDDDLIEIKVALNMPYLQSAKNFVRVDGEIELSGVHYNYVKRKVAGDTLYLLCLPNFLKTQLADAKTELAKDFSDVPANKKNAETTSAKKQNSINDYNIVTEQFALLQKSGSEISINNFICPDITSVFIKSPTQPPDVNA